MYMQAVKSYPFMIKSTVHFSKRGGTIHSTAIDMAIATDQSLMLGVLLSHATVDMTIVFCFVRFLGGSTR